MCLLCLTFPCHWQVAVQDVRGRFEKAGSHPFRRVTAMVDYDRYYPATVNDADAAHVALVERHLATDSEG